jgi:adenylate kinase
VEGEKRVEPFVIIVAGTPGVGKSTFSRALAEELQCKVVEPSLIAMERSLGRPDPERPGTLIIDEEALLRAVRDELSRPCTVISTHYPSLFLDDLSLYDVTAAVALLRLNPLILMRRLEGRGWERRKVLENVMAEALGSVAHEVLDYGDMVFEIDVSGIEVNEALDVFFEKLVRWDSGVKLDWLSLEEIAVAVASWGAELDLHENGS